MGIYVWVKNEYSQGLKVFREQPRHSLGHTNVLTDPYYRLNMQKMGKLEKRDVPPMAKKRTRPGILFEQFYPVNSEPQSPESTQKTPSHPVLDM